MGMIRCIYKYKVNLWIMNDFPDISDNFSIGIPLKCIVARSLHDFGNGKSGIYMQQGCMKYLA